MESNNETDSIVPNDTLTQGETEEQRAINGEIDDSTSNDPAAEDGASSSANAEGGASSAAEEKREETFYNFDDYVSKPTYTQDSQLPLDVLTLYHSFGYDCKKRRNLHLMDEETVIFAAGNLLQILNLHTTEQRYFRTSGGGGIGAIAVHPSRKYFAVAEKGTLPCINIFEYPSLRLYKILRDGTQKAYASVDFSPDGELLASVGSDPDYMLTVWSWQQEKTMLRYKAFSQDVYKVSFSPENPGQLTTSGSGHIRFWTMARTFTGLKLQGAIGRFGRTEISDIEGYVELPDGKVLSGSEWGNMLLWEGGLIKVEISRKAGKTCHQGAIMQFVMDEGELISVGQDGFIRVWDFETIDQADTSDESVKCELEPMRELRVGSNAILTSMVKSLNPDTPTIWYAQDANGGIWKVDLAISLTSKGPEKLFSYHGGEVTDCDVSPVSHLVATIGTDGTLRVYDYYGKKPLCDVRYGAGGSIVRWMPKAVDRRGSTLVAGFSDGVVRVLSLVQRVEQDISSQQRGSSELVLTQVYKPHSGRVTAIALDASSSLLATAGADNTIFFFHVGNNALSPLGFITVPASATYLTWTPAESSDSRLLISCCDGRVVEVAAPKHGDHDSKKTYHMTNLNSRTFTFKSVKSKIKRAEERKRKEEEKNKRQKEKEERIKRLKAKGMEPEEEEEDEEEEEEEEPLFYPDEPSAILQGFYSSTPGMFWLTMDGYDTGYLYRCRFMDEEQTAAMDPELVGEPSLAVHLECLDSVAVNCISFSENNRQLLMGLANGAVRIQTLREEAQDYHELGVQWTLTMHDNGYGHVTRVRHGYDGRFVVTTGADGNVFIYRCMEETLIDRAVSATRIPSAEKHVAERKIDDIDDPNYYSIEDAKQKAESDRCLKASEAKKQACRRKINTLRHQFRKLLQHNDELPPHLRLDRKVFELDPELKEQQRALADSRIENVRRELEYEAIRHQIALDKLKHRFKDVMECERIELTAFLFAHTVSTFRCAKLSEEFHLVKADLAERRQRARNSPLTSKEGSMVSREGTATQLRPPPSDGSKAEVSVKESSSGLMLKSSRMADTAYKALNKAEEKKRKKAQRRAEWDALYASRPDDNYEDPAYLASIRAARDNMGDYKLKTAEDYAVPDHLRMNTDKKRAQLLELRTLLHQHKCTFNAKLLELRRKKETIIEEVGKLSGELEEVQGGLRPELLKPAPSIPLTMKPCEVPERKLEYTTEKLLAFKEKMEREKTDAPKQDGFGGFGGFGGGGGGGGTVEKKSSVALHARHKSQQLVSRSSLLLTSATIAGATNLTPLEQELQTMDEIKLVYRQDELLRVIDETLQMFDAELMLLRHEKSCLEVDVKNGDLRQMTLYQELVLLKEFEKRENILAGKVETKVEEKLEMENKAIECMQKLEGKRKVLETLQESEKDLQQRFLSLLGENNKFADFLTKVYKKKIKRVKKVQKEEGSDGGSDEDDSDDDDSDWSESEDGSDSDGGRGLDDSVCPAGCEQTMYDTVCALRENRLDIEEAVTEEKRSCEMTRKEHEAIMKKVKIIDGVLHAEESDLEAFQLEKQRKLNELDVVVTLRLEQIQHVVHAQLPADLQPSIVIDAATLRGLQLRIHQLQQEKTEQRKQYRELRQHYSQLIKDRRLHEERLAELSARCSENMMLKFGRIVDLDMLESVGVNRAALELREKLRESETRGAAETRRYDLEISKQKERLVEVTHAHTRTLNMYNMLLQECTNLETKLDNTTNKTLDVDFSGASQQEEEEMFKLQQLVDAQTRELDTLNQEIFQLTHKGGHLAPPQCATSTGDVA